MLCDSHVTAQNICHGRYLFCNSKEKGVGRETMEHKVSSDLVQKCICCCKWWATWFTYVPNWSKCWFGSNRAPINHKLVTALLQTAVWGNVEHYSHHTTQKVQWLYPIALRKHRVAHYLTWYSISKCRFWQCCTLYCIILLSCYRSQGDPVSKAIWHKNMVASHFPDKLELKSIHWAVPCIALTLSNQQQIRKLKIENWKDSEFGHASYGGGLLNKQIKGGTLPRVWPTRGLWWSVEFETDEGGVLISKTDLAFQSPIQIWKHMWHLN